MKPVKEIRLNLLHLGTFFPNEVSIVVKNVESGIKKAKSLMKQYSFYGFYFSEHEYISYKGKRYWDIDNDTKPIVYYQIAESIVTHNDVVKLGNQTLLFNMEVNRYKYIIRTILGNYQPYLNEKETIVLDKNFKPMQLPD